MDEVLVAATPPMHLRLIGGTPGDLATGAMLVNMLPRVVNAPAGLLTMLDVPVPGIVVQAAGNERPRAVTGFGACRGTSPGHVSATRPACRPPC